ncbi:MAG: nitrous oxide reductase accessory protein NosL [Thiovulaceae bacterium]|nr:nitrous oxide reductase accessory protein NosL [Sulfurimonadaceae bacterium]MCW9025873.1 nitrous oxide reductase accessory protein NosL [Sulfurimonadaceae bacterium]
MNKIIYPLVASLLLLSGCGDTKPANTKNVHKMFQSVSKEKAVLIQSGKEKQFCIRCGMDLVKFYKTSHASHSEDGETNYQYCSIHCLEDHLGDGVALKNPKVVDVKSLKLISVADATYVVGSKVRGTMTRVSKYAFLNKEDALVFQKENGGKIMDFNGALSKAKEDFEHYNRH